MVRCGWKVNGVAQLPFERYIGQIPIMVKVLNSVFRQKLISDFAPSTLLLSIFVVGTWLFQICFVTAGWASGRASGL